MEKKIIIALVCLFSISGMLHAQDAPIVRKGLIRTQATITTSKIFGGDAYFYLHGTLEGYLNNHVSFLGDCFYYLGDISSDVSPFDFNHSVFWGAAWHFSNKSHDLYVGLQPGISFTRINRHKYDLQEAQFGVNPLVSPILGYNFYVHRFFHFFVQTRLVFGEHNYDIHQSLSEFRFSAGLGFNLNAMKAR